MKIGVSTTIKYNINNNVVTCVVTPVRDGVRSTLFDMEYGAERAGISTAKRLTLIPKEFKGVARLKAGDEVDLALAKEIARKKAIRKMYRVYHNQMKLAAEYFGMAWGRYLDAAIELANKANEIDNEIVKLTSKESQG